ncbi:MAG: enoyl-CoA hydratase [bacterium TMED88]|nr:enoyl-CoA hydratase [Deltaproteobacteria bacterium]OUV37275.1 MAG: enoyl-CoA hydratase [bacterium TMED88]
MNTVEQIGDIKIRLGSDHVAEVELCRPPENFFDSHLIESIAESFERLDSLECRAIVLCSEGKHFCAGANLNRSEGDDTERLYGAAVRLFSSGPPVLAAIQGAAVGGGLGLALMPDFRIAAPEARFSANFSQLGFHQGFGLSVTLPRLVGPQIAQEMLYTGRRIPGEEALHLGLCDRLAPKAMLREEAFEFAREIARAAPLAIRSIRQTLRGELAEEIRIATAHEATEQARLQKTQDFREGVRAMSERRRPHFKGR